MKQNLLYIFDTAIDVMDVSLLSWTDNTYIHIVQYMAKIDKSGDVIRFNTM